MTQVFRIGLTGGIGSGKTTVSSIFQSLGVPVIDADEIAREVVEPGKRAYERIVALFGNRVVAEDGSLRRDLIREAVFRDNGLKSRLETIIHPEVRDEIENRVRSCCYPYCIISIPLLLESGSDYHLDRILVIDTSEDSQLRRTMLRDGIDEDLARSIMDSQAGRQDRLAIADDVIDNTGDMEYLEKQVNTLHHAYLGLAGKPEMNMQTPG